MSDNAYMRYKRENTDKGASVDRLENVPRELVLAQLLDNRLRAGIRRRHNRSQHALDLVQSVFKGLDVALRGPSSKTRRCTHDKVKFRKKAHQHRTTIPVYVHSFIERNA